MHLAKATQSDFAETSPAQQAAGRSVIQFAVPNKWSIARVWLTEWPLFRLFVVEKVCIMLAPSFSQEISGGTTFKTEDKRNK